MPSKREDVARRRKAFQRLEAVAQKAGVRVGERDCSLGAARGLVGRLRARAEPGDVPEVEAAWRVFQGGPDQAPDPDQPPPQDSDPLDDPDDPENGFNEGGPLGYALVDPSKKGFRLRGRAFLLTYNSSAIQPGQFWNRFLSQLRAKVASLKIRHWCATVEQSLHSGDTSRFHIHAYIVLSDEVDHRTTELVWIHVDGAALKPNVRKVCAKAAAWQRAVDRGFFYCAAEKVGSMGTEGNYLPFEQYHPEARWIRDLWKTHKLTHEKAFALGLKTREGYGALKRAVEEVVRDEQADRDRKEMENVKRRMVPKLHDFCTVEPVSAWQKLFLDDEARYPFLLVLAKSGSGKTEFAKSLFRNPLELKIGMLEYFPSLMKEFDRGKHDAVILDNISDVGFLIRHEEKLQGKYDQLVEFAPCATGVYSYTKYLYRIPLVVTCNYGAKNLGVLLPGNHDYFGALSNRVIIKFKTPTFCPPSSLSSSSSSSSSASSSSSSSSSSLASRFRPFAWDGESGAWEEVV